MRGRTHRRPSRLADISPRYQHAQPCAYLGLQLQGRRHSRPLRHAAESLQNSAEQSEGHAVRNAARTELRRFRIIEGVEVDYSRSAEQRSAATQRSAIKKSVERNSKEGVASGKSEMSATSERSDWYVPRAQIARS